MAGKITLPRMWTAAELLADTTPISPDVVAGFIPAVQAALWSGPGGDGKSYLALDLALHVAAGIEWLGMAVRQTPTLIIDLENEFTRLRERLRDTIEAHHLDDAQVERLPLHLAFGLASRLCRDESIVEIAEMAKSWGAGLVVLDSLVDFLGDVDENDNRLMAEIALRLRRIAQVSGATILPIHHTPKANKDTPRGATSLRNGLCVSTMINRDKDNLTIKVDKNRCAPCKTVVAHLCWGPGTFDVELVGVKSSATQTTDADEQALLDALANGKWQVSDQVIRAAMGVTGHARRTVQDKLRDLVLDGFVERGEQANRRAYNVRLDVFKAALGQSAP